MEKKTAPFAWIDWLLLTAIAGLSVHLLVTLLGPAVVAWKNRPRPGAQVSQQYRATNRANATAAPVNYLLYLPAQYETSRCWPMVVFLHGSGERGDDVELLGQTGLPKFVSQHDDCAFILVSPQCRADCRWRPEAVVGLIEHLCGSLAVDRDRVYLTGYSMGGSGSWATASYDPGRFAAIAPLCGGGDVEQADRLKHLPIWAFHGAKDDVVPLEASRVMADAVRKCGGHVRFTVYPGADHGICERTYQDARFYKWLLDQRRSRQPG